MSLTEALDTFHAAQAASAIAGPGTDADLELAVLTACQALIDDLEMSRRVGVGLSRSAGATWVEIGAVMAVSKQAAQQRYGTAG